MRLTGSRPSSLKVGTFGSAARRSGAATATATSRPSLTKGRADGRLSKIIGTWPATASFKAGPAPRYGMWVMKVPVSDLNNSICKWPIVPVPELANENLPGLALTLARNDAKSLAGNDGCTASTFGVAAMLMIDVKSAGLYEIFGLMAGLDAVVDTVAIPSV